MTTVGLLSLFRKSRQQPDRRDERRVLQAGSEDDILELARKFAEQGDDARATTLLRKGLGRHPHSTLLAESLQSFEQHALEKTIQKLLPRLSSDDRAETRAHISELYRRSGDLKAALMYGREAIQIAPDAPDGYRVVGAVYLNQFRNSQNSFAGMNALRCLLKAHTLAPQDSLYLLQLAEIFIILRAPRAASRFLQPVQKAFKHDPQVLALESRVQELPPQDVTQIQDLFSMLEQQGSGGAPGTGVQAALSGQAIDAMVGLTGGLSSDESCFLVDGTRNIAWARCTSDYDKKELGASFGLLAETARQISKRMGIGKFSSLHITSPELVCVVGYVKKDLYLFFTGNKTNRFHEADLLIQRAREVFSGALSRSAP